MKSFLSHINKLNSVEAIGQRRLFTSLFKLKQTGIKLDRPHSFNLYKFGGASLLTAIGLLLAPTSAQAAPVDLLFSTPTCVGNPTATTTTATCLVVGSKWRFSNVVIGGTAGTQRDAIVTIVSSVGSATVTNMNTTGGYQNVNFQPTVTVPSVASSTAYVVFNIEFVTPGTSTPVTIGGEVYETAFDVDGIGTVNNIREFVEFGTPSSTYLASTTDLVLDPVPFTTGGVRYIVASSDKFFNGITNNPVYEATALYPATTSSLNLILGAKNGTVACTACARQSSVSFKVSDIVPINDLFITKSHTGNFTVGIPASYTINVGNTGAATSGNIVIRDPLPSGLTIPNGSVAITGTNASAWTCSATSNVITCTSTTPIVAKGSSTFNITGIAVGSAAVPSVSNTATITTGGGSVTFNDAATDVATVIPTFSVSGTVFDDANGGTIDGTGTNASSATLTAYLVSTGTTPVTLAKVNVGATGIYSFPPVIAGNYTVRLSNDATGALNVAPPAASLPTNYVNTGEGVGATPTTADAAVDGITAITVSTANLANVNFGIDQLPDTTNLNPASQINPGLAVTVTVPTLAGTDPEDGALGTGKSFRIISLPTNGTLYYPNALNVPVAVTAGQVITNYDPAKLKLDPNDGAITVTFTYAAVDAAGKEDPTPATVTMPFTAPVTTISITGTVWNDKDNSGAVSPFTNIQTNGEGGTNAVFGTTTTAVNAILVNTLTGLVIDSQVVSSTNGTYTFSNVPTAIGLQVILSPTAGTLAAAPPLGAAPVGWVKTAPVAVSVPAGVTSVSGVDFGIRQKAKLVLVKRITKINTTAFADITTDTWNPGVGNWPANYLVGKVDAGVVKPGDSIEYTIYFLNNQGADATGVKICDPIRGNHTYVPNSSRLRLGAATSDTPLIDGTDRANSYPAGILNIPAGCNATGSTATGTDNGGVAIGITGTITPNQPARTAVPGSIGIADPTTAYGLFRFTTLVKP